MWVLGRLNRPFTIRTFPVVLRELIDEPMPGLAEKADRTTKASGESIIGSARSWFILERYRQSLRTLPWNAGELHSQVFRELETCAVDFALDVCMVQETKWTFDGNWSTPHYHFTHSAGEAKED